MSSGEPTVQGAHASRTIAVLLTVHDRKAHTLECLARVHAQALPDGVALDVFLVDDGCTDGTAAAVRRGFPHVRVLPGSGGLYWNGGMRLAFEAAQRSDPDFYLLLNDDTYLDAVAFSTLLRASDELGARGHGEAIVVGSTRDPETGEPTYGGQQRLGRWAPGFALVPPGPMAVRCDTMNGNCVLVPRAVARRVGNLSPDFTHAFGDIDYGLRATRAGCSCWIAPGFVGTCTHNPNLGSYVDEGLPVLVRWRKMQGAKGASFRQWRAFTSSHCGPFWPVYWLRTYAKFWTRAPLIAALRWSNGRRRVAEPPAARIAGITKER